MELPIVYQLHNPDGPMNYFHAWTEREVAYRNWLLVAAGYYWTPYEEDDIPITLGMYCIEDAVVQYLSDAEDYLGATPADTIEPIGIESELTPFGLLED